jgi:hypothetical protein
MEVQAAEVHPAIWAVGLWFLLVTLSGWVVTRTSPPPVTLMSRPVTPPGRLALATAATRERLWRWAGAAMFALSGQLSGGRARWAQRLSLRYTRRAARLEVSRRRRAIAAARDSERATAWDRTLASSPCSPPSRPPSAPRPSLNWNEDESTRRWERTLPYGTPSPLLTREGRGKPYPFVPLAPPLPQPSSSRRRRNP